jgi:hypothetical protein
MELAWFMRFALLRAGHAELPSGLFCGLFFLASHSTRIPARADAGCVLWFFREKMVPPM